MADERKQAQDDADDDRVSLHPIDPELALVALLATPKDADNDQGESDDD